MLHCHPPFVAVVAAACLKTLSVLLFIRQGLERYRHLKINRDLNSDFSTCPSYPQTLLTPVNMSDAQLKAAANYRTKGRMPAVVWVHPSADVIMCRSSQPRTGLSGKTSPGKQPRVVCTPLSPSFRWAYRYFYLCLIVHVLLTPSICLCCATYYYYHYRGRHAASISLSE